MTLSYTGHHVAREAATQGTPSRAPALAFGARAARRVSVAVLSGAIVLASAPTTVRSADPPATLAARELASSLGGTEADFQLIHEAPTVAGGGWAGKLVDLRSGEVHAVHLDADGTVTDEAAALNDQDGGAIALRGKADRALAHAMANAQASARLPVAIWLDTDTEPAEASVRAAHPEVEWLAGRPLAASLDQARTLRGELWEARRIAYAAAAEGLRAQVEAAGGTIAYVSTSAPIVFADVPAAGMDALAARPRGPQHRTRGSVGDRDVERRPNGPC